LLFSALVSAQRGNVYIAASSEISIPDGAQLCPDTIFANSAGFGTLTIANNSCICQGAVVIPVELLSFSASLENEVVYLHWSTAGETNNYGFEVERYAAFGWERIGFVEGNGTTVSTSEYSYNDNLDQELLKQSVIYYRLKQLDFDGRYEYSPEVEVHPSQQLAIPALYSIVPNPAGEYITVQFSITDDMPATLRIVSALGQEVHSYTGEHSRGVSSLRINIRPFMPGLYFVVLTTSEGTQIERFIKQ
jgi:hypothetical protein